MRCYYTRSFLLRSFLIFSLFVFHFSLQSQTLFVGADGADWFIASNWSNGLPTTGNDATVPNGKTVVISKALNVNFNIQSFGGIKNTAALTLATNLVSGGLITNIGTLTINSGIQLTSSGGINNSGTITNNGTCNSNSVFTNALGSIVNNNSTWTQQAALTNNGTFCINAGTFTCPQVFTNNAAVKILTGATFKVDFGGAFTNAAGSTLINGGAFSNVGTFLNTTTVTNTGTFTNNSTHTCNGVFNNESGGSFVSTSTVNINGRINNKVGATVNNSFNFNVNRGGYVSNAGGFTNGNTIKIVLGGTVSNEATGVITTNFGSNIVDSGTVINNVGGQIAGNGSLTTTWRFDNLGLFDAQGGSQITIGDTLNNTGTFRSINIFTNNGYVFSTGSLQNLSGGTWINNNTLVNEKPGVFINGFEYDNKAGASTTNNGTFIDNVRVYNDGNFTNNAYVLAVGDFYNRAGATLLNTEVIEVNQGAIVNDAAVTNTKSVYLDQCSVLTNRATINNTGNIISSAIIFQRGTIAGNAINKVSGFIQTAATSAAPICRAGLSTGTDLTGAAKVYGQNPVLPTLGIDSCAGFQYFIENTTRKVFTCAQVGTTVSGHFTLLVRTGDSLTCTLPITIFDGVAPTFTNCPSDVTVQTINTTEKYTWAGITATDNCLGTVSIVSTVASGSSFNLGATSVVVTAKDASNNARDCRFTVNVVKVSTPVGTSVPAFANCPANISVTVASGAAAATWSEPTLTGSALPIVITKTNGSGSLFGAGVSTVVYTATDANGKTATCTFTVTVTAGDICSSDNINPVIQNCPANIFLVTNPVITSAVAIWKAPTASDNCASVTLTSNYTSGTIFPVGTQTVVYTATDAKNNTATCTFTINQGAINPCAGDVTGPAVTNCPNNITQNATDLTAAVTWTPPTATDNCSPIITNASAQPGNNFVVGTTPVLYQFSDKIGNLSTCKFSVTLVNNCLNDTLPPVLGACPANITVETLYATSLQSAVATFTNPTATDNCSTPSVVATPASGSLFLVDTTTVTEVATDSKGNSSKCIFTVTVTANPCANDIIPPVLAACPTNIIVTATGTTAVATWTNPTATDNCSTPTVVSSPLSGSSFNIGTTTVTVTATGSKGNSSKCTFTVTVNAPTATCTAPPTPTGWMALGQSGNNFYFKYTDNNATFSNAQNLITSIGGHFPTITNATTNAFLASAINGTFWIGLTRNGANWTNYDGVNAAYFNWNAGDPNNHKGNENNVEVYSNGTWNDVNDDAHAWTVAEIPCAKTCPGVKGSIKQETWTNIGGYGIEDLKEKTQNFTTKPTTVTNISNFILPANNIEKTGDRVRGFIYPPFSGAYKFTVYGDDQTNLYLSTDNTPSNKLLICNVNLRTDEGELTREPNQVSQTINLVGGKEYYIELQHKQGGGGNNFGVLWTLPNAAAPLLITGNFLAPYDNCSGTIQPPPVCETKGTFYFERWLNINYNRAQPIAMPTNAPNDIIINVPSDLKMPAPNVDVNYMSRGQGYITAPESGDYYFDITGDDYDELFLSSSTDATKSSLIAYKYGWTNADEFRKYPTQKSGKTTLVAGHKYYFEVRHYQGWGGDDFHIYWKTPSKDDNWVVIPSTVLSYPCTIQKSAALNKNIFAFYVTASNRTANITWLSNAGQTTDFYTVEKLNTLGNFESIYKISGLNGSDKITTFSFIDTKTVNGDNFYRITTTFTDGTQSVSEIKKVTFDKLNSFAVFPNPTDDFLDIDLSNYAGKAVGISIYNTVGQRVYQFNYESAPRAAHRVETDGFVLGAHWVKIDVKGLQSQTKQIVIAR